MADDEVPAVHRPPPFDLNPEAMEQRRLSFGSSAAAYDTYRPSYPMAAVQWAIGSQPRRVLEIGAGTGLMTRVLLTLGHHVTAVEPDDNMRAQLALTSDDRLAVVPGSAEHLLLPDGSVDAIVVAQAFHWFQLPLALPEMHRVLRPDGALAVLWNRRNDHVGWVEQMSQIVGRHDARSGNRDTSLDDLSPWFTGVESTVYEHDVTLNVDSLVGLVDTYSYVRLSPDREKVLEAIHTLATTHPDLANKASFDLPTETVTYRAQRASIT